MMAARRRIAAVLAGTLACTFSSPALANSSAAEYFRARAVSNNVPELLSRSERDWYKSLFAAIDLRDWTRVDAMFADESFREAAKAACRYGTRK